MALRERGPTAINGRLPRSGRVSDRADPVPIRRSGVGITSLTALSRYIFSLVPSRRVAPSGRRLGAYLPPFRPPTSLPLLPPVYSALCATASGARLPLPTAPLGNNDCILLCYIILPGPAAVNCMRGHPHHLASYRVLFHHSGNYG
jgi:hypothetical protein